MLAKKRKRHAPAGKERKGGILDQLVELFGCHRKAAIRALRPRRAVSAPLVLGRPKEHDPQKPLPPLQAIWPRVNAPYRGARNRLLNGFLPTLKPGARSGWAAGWRGGMDRW